MLVSSQGALRKNDNDFNYENKRRNSYKKNKEQKQVVIAVGSIDYTTLLITSILLLIGVVMVFSAGYYNAATRKEFNYDMYYFLKKQGFFAILGFSVMMFMSQINYRYLMRLGFPLYIVSNILLIWVAIGTVASHGAKRWIELPVIGRFQPSELSKVAVILLISFIIHKHKNILKNWGGFLLCCGIVGLTMGLVLLGNLSTALIVGIIGFGTIFVASPHVLRFVIAGMTAVGGLVSYIAFFSKGFRGERFDAWLDPFADPRGYGFQIIQSLFAIASGGPFGLGIGQSRQKSFIPEPHNDFIFSIICEELGAVGAAIVLILFAVLIWRGIKIAMEATDVFGTMVATGIILMIASQVIINVAVVTNSIPNTGVPMPFISYGGTALLITMFLMGILLNISRHSKAGSD